MPHAFPPPIRGARSHWDLDPFVVFLNHGSFGACPTPVLAKQADWRARMEREPVLFLGREIEGLLDEARAEVAEFLGAQAEDLAFVPNATAGVNAVLRSLRFEPGDEIVVANHGYNACNNAARWVLERTGGRVVVADVPYPVPSFDAVVDAVLAAVTPRTKLALLDHVTSQTALVFPIHRLVAELQGRRGIDVLVDGAHAPGMVALDLDVLGAAYYVGNGHKWLCGPKGAAFLHVRRDRRDRVAPLAISHGLNMPRTDKSLFQLLFDWTGTADPTPWLCLPDAIRFVSTLLPGGMDELQLHWRAKALAARDLVCDALGVAPPAPDLFIGSLATAILPRPPAEAPAPPLFLHPLQAELWEKHRIEIPVMPAPNGRDWSIRLSAAPYNEESDYRRLADALRASRHV
jgi:isopenicillin-N epimerase